jgi:hypothetical protein
MPGRLTPPDAAPSWTHAGSFAMLEASVIMAHLLLAADLRLVPALEDVRVSETLTIRPATLPLRLEPRPRA